MDVVSGPVARAHNGTGCRAGLPESPGTYPSGANDAPHSATSRMRDTE